MITTTFGKCNVGFPSPLVSHAIKASHRGLIRPQFKLSEERDDTIDHFDHFDHFDRAPRIPPKRRSLQFPLKSLAIGPRTPFKSFNFDDSPPPHENPLASNDALPYSHLLDTNPQKIAHALESAQRSRGEEEYDSDVSIRSRSSASDVMTDSERSPKFPIFDFGTMDSKMDGLKALDSLDQSEEQPNEQLLEAEAAIDVAKFLVDDWDKHNPPTTTEILESLEVDPEPSISPPPSPKTSSPMLPLLSIDPTQTILSESALTLLRNASLSGKKVGLGSVATSLAEPGSTGMRQTLSTTPIVGVHDVDKAEAAFSIARQLVDWAESVVVMDSKVKMSDEELLNFTLSGESLQGSTSDLEDPSSDHSDSDVSREEDSQSEEEPSSIKHEDIDTQWISATDYFERRKAEHLLSRLSVQSPPHEQDNNF